MRCSASVRLLDFFLGMTGDSAINELVARWRSVDWMSTNSLVIWVGNFSRQESESIEIRSPVLRPVLESTPLLTCADRHRASLQTSFDERLLLEYDEGNGLSPFVTIKTTAFNCCLPIVANRPGRSSEPGDR